MLNQRNQQVKIYWNEHCRSLANTKQTDKKKGQFFFHSMQMKTKQTIYICVCVCVREFRDNIFLFYLIVMNSNKNQSVC